MQSLIITSIAGSANKILNQYAKDAVENNTKFILIGDKKTPENFNLKDCDYYSIERQKQQNFKLSNYLPYNHYARKNLGYLIAAKNGAEIIIETDDDNIPYPEFWETRKLWHNVETIEHPDWINIYNLFTDKKVWTRGFPLELINEKKDICFKEKNIECPIQQGLADDNPDVDAAFRLTHKLPIKFNKNLAFALGKNSISPFNSQNTTWFKKAFPLLYLPSYCSFRMTDIWRSFIAQRLAWTCDWGILYHSPTVYQERNEHNILNDFEQEIPGYLYNFKIMDSLCNLDLKAGENCIFENLIKCYTLMLEKKWLTDNKELKLLETWIKDLQEFGF
jgi:hypothetical protein